MPEVGVRMAAWLPPDAAGDLPMAKALLEGLVLNAADRGEVELTEGWQMAEVTSEVRCSHFSDERVCWVTGVALGARRL